MFHKNTNKEMQNLMKESERYKQQYEEEHGKVLGEDALIKMMRSFTKDGGSSK